MLPASRCRRTDAQSGATLLQLSIAISIVVVLAAITLPPFLRKVRLVRTNESIERLAELYRKNQSYWAGGQVGPVVPVRTTLHTLPPSAALTPAAVPAGHSVVDPPGTWSAATWRGFDFSITEAHYFSYEYSSSGEGALSAFTIRALGDLDGNGLLSTFERSGQSSPSLEMTSSTGLWIDHGME